jgi:SpoVK/Ycf46/Vps4 family AAA+-type ATPase
MYGEIISQQGFGPKKDISMPDMIRFDLLQFLVYLIDTGEGNMQPQITFIHSYLGQYFTADRLLNFKYERTEGSKFTTTVPRSFTYFAEADTSGSSTCTTKGFTKSRNLLNLYISIGQEFIACNSSVTEEEMKRFTAYTGMIEKYLRSHKIYEAGSGHMPKSILDNAGSSTKASPVTPATGATTSYSSPAAALEAMKGQLNKQEIPEEELKLEDLMNELNSLAGLEQVKTDIKSLISLLKVKKLREERGMKQPSVSLHMVFSGNPGTGKTTVARLLAKIYKCIGVLPKGQLIEVDRSGLVEGYVGQTAIKTKEVVESALGGILFIDEAYTLTAGKDGKDFGQEAVDTLLKLMEDNRDNLVVIVAGYTDLMEEFVNSNPGLRSRFNKYIFFQDYTGEQLYNIFLDNCKRQEYEPNEPGKKYVREYLEKKANNHDENFANAREVRNYLERSIARQASRIMKLDNVSDKQLKTLTKADLVE